MYQRPTLPRPHRRECDDVADRRAVGQQHHQPVNADAETAAGRQTVFERRDVILVERLRLVVAGGARQHLRLEAAPLIDRVVKQTSQIAEILMARHKASGYGTTLAAADYVWGSNSVAANQALLLLMANHFQPDGHTMDPALGNLHYLLGRNCFGVSWVTQVGSNPFQHPHHRPSEADGVAAPWPGLLSGGPNAKPSDPVGLTLPQSPPMRMWMDDERAYSLNEVAINWNASLVFLLAAACAQA